MVEMGVEIGVELLMLDSRPSVLAMGPSENNLTSRVLRHFEKKGGSDVKLEVDMPTASWMSASKACKYNVA